MKLFTDGARFLKGNLHTHTTISDGRVSAGESIRRYKEAGYDFLSITDHRKRFGGYIETKDGRIQMASEERALADGDDIIEAISGEEDYRFLVIPGTEFDRNFIWEAPEHAYHITGVGIRHYIPQTNEWTPQEIVDAIHAEGGYATLAHPIWSLMTVEECMDLQRYDATEIYNTVSDVYSGRGTSDIYIDMMASRGRYVPFMAADDTHYYDRDPFGGFIMVEAEKNNWPSIHQALLEGRFYSSQGPKIYQIEKEGGEAPGEKMTVSVQMSPVVSIRFTTNALYNGYRTVYPPPGEKTLTEASYTLADSERFVRIEGRDEQGKLCWSNLIVKA